jgi:decaprenyl-diphosphate synthase subunit 1
MCCAFASISKKIDRIDRRTKKKKQSIFEMLFLRKVRCFSTQEMSYHGSNASLAKLLRNLSEASADVDAMWHSRDSSRVQTQLLQKDRSDDDDACKFRVKVEDPFAQVSNELEQLNVEMKRRVRTEHPLLAELAKYYFELPGKRLRPVVVLLMSQAIDAHRRQVRSGQANRRQLQLAQIVEMIHAASIVHDDVIDEATMRRGMASVNARYSNKLAVLSGDFMLARASVALARLRSHRATELISNTIADLVEGEFLQIDSSNPLSFSQYAKKSYLKTASLITNSCTAAAVLADDNDESADSALVDAATDYGNNLGMAFQYVDDVLDFTGTDESLGKPAGIDLKLGLATGPVLFAVAEHAELGPLVDRRFSVAGDVERATQLVHSSKGIEKTLALAADHCHQANEALDRLQPSMATDALRCLTELMLTRTK